MFVCLYVCVIDWLIDWLVDWLIDWLIECLFVACVYDSWPSSLQSEERRIEAFFTIWALKESYIKAIGEGLGFPLQEVNHNLYIVIVVIVVIIVDEDDW